MIVLLSNVDSQRIWEDEIRVSVRDVVIACALAPLGLIIDSLPMTMFDGQQLLEIYLHLLPRMREALHVQASDVPHPHNFVLTIK